MRNLLTLLAILTTSFATSQWSASTEIDPFDGNTTTVIGTGYGGSFPYQNPSIVFRVIKGELDVFITEAGSLACEEAYIEFSFGDPNNIIRFGLNKSRGGDAGFFRFSPSQLDPLVKKLKSGSISYVKFITRCSQMRFKLSLKGSTSKLNRIFGAKWDADRKVEVDSRNKSIKEAKDQSLIAKVSVDKLLDSLNITLFEDDYAEVVEQLGKKIKTFGEVKEITIKRHIFKGDYFRMYAILTTGYKFESYPYLLQTGTYSSPPTYKSAYYEGGSTWGLDQREIEFQGKINELKCDIEGTVVVRVVVSRYGRVVEAKGGVKGSTKAYPCMLEEAERAAKYWKFTGDADAPEKQVGYLVYEFKKDDSFEE